MSTCLSFEDIVALGDPQISHLEEIGQTFLDANTRGACEAFSKQVRLLESCLVQTYAVAASIARKSDDLLEVSQIWDRMRQFCTKVLQVLTGLKDKYPDCGTPELYDLALDYSLACTKRHHNTLDELACQTTPLPKGLFPEQI